MQGSPAFCSFVRFIFLHFFDFIILPINLFRFCPIRFMMKQSLNRKNV